MAEYRTVKYRAWIPHLKEMRPVRSIHMGDDGASLTVTFETAPFQEYYQENSIVPLTSGMGVHADHSSSDCSSI